MNKEMMQSEKAKTVKEESNQRIQENGQRKREV